MIGQSEAYIIGGECMFMFSPVRFAAAVVLGVAAAGVFGIEIVGAAAAAAAAVGVVLLILKKNAGAVVIFAAAFAAGGISYTINTGADMHKTIDYIGRYVTVHGVVQSQGIGNSYDDNLKYNIRVTAVDKNGDAEEFRDNLLLTTPQELSCGDKVTLNGIIKDMPSQMNENGPDTAKYYGSQGIFTRMYTDEVVSEGGSNSVSPLILTGKFREAADRLIYSHYTGDGAAVLSAVLTGNYHHFSERLSDALDETAFKRLYHPAYLHIFLIMSVVGLFANVVPRRVRDIVLMTVFLAYALLNSAGTGFVRCLLTAALTIFMRIKNGNAHYQDTMAWLVAGCGIAMPLLLFNAGFVMSVTGGLLIWAFGPYVRERLRFLPKRIRQTAAVMVICAVFQLPLSAYYFNGVCLYALLMPFIMGPLVLLVLVTAPVTLMLMSLTGGAFLLKGFVDVALWAMIKLPYFINLLPFSKITIPTPTAAVMGAAALFTAAAYYYIKKKNTKLIFSAAAGCGLAAAAAAVSLTRLGTADFIFVNVGQGDGSVIHTYMGDTVLIDGGGGSSYSEYDPGKSIFVPFLESKGYSVIEAAFVSHCHKDHVQGIIAAVDSLKVKNVFIPSEEFLYDDEMREWAAELERTAEENGTAVHYVSEDMRIRLESGLVLTVHVPSETVRISDDGNDASFLIKAEYKGTSCLYTGDMTEFSERYAVREGVDVDADILKAAHHGSKTSTSEEFVEAVSPEYSVICCGENNSYGHPAQQTLERLKDTIIFRTDINGNVTFTADEEGIRSTAVFKKME